MRTARLEDMVKGWFVGNFEPTLIKTNDVEVAVKATIREIMKKNIITKLRQSSLLSFKAE